MNNEMKLVAELLNDTSLITAIEVDSTWFENFGYKNIIEAINRLRGTSYTLEQVHREMRVIDYFQSGTIEDLELLKGFATAEGNEEELARQVHIDYLEHNLSYMSSVFAQTLSKQDGDKLQGLLSEYEETAYTKPNGHLQNAFVEFSKSLDEENNAVKTFEPLDQFLGGGITGGKLIVLAGRPATGKTAFALNIMEQAFEKNQDVACDFFTFEMGQNELITRLVSKKTRINSLLFISRKLTEENKKKSRQAYMDMMQKYDMRVFTSEHSKLNDIKMAIKKRKDDKKHYIAFVDYAGLITVNDTRKNERQVMNEVTRELKKLTTDYNITIFLLAQMSRAVESRSDKKPMLSDLKESGSLEQDANAVLFLSADENDPKRIACDIAKNREGLTGVAPFIFTKQFMDFSVDFDRWRG